MSLVKTPVARSVDCKCNVCGWTLSASNAMGTAAQHAERYSHEVLVRVVQVTLYTPAR